MIINIAKQNFLSNDTQIEGNLIFKSPTIINSLIKGNIVSTDEIIVEFESKIEGNISSPSIIIKGHVNGDITSTGKVELTSTASVIGRIKSYQLSVAPGAQLVTRNEIIGIVDNPNS